MSYEPSLLNQYQPSYENPKNQPFLAKKRAVLATSVVDRPIKCIKY